MAMPPTAAEKAETKPATPWATRIAMMAKTSPWTVGAASAAWSFSHPVASETPWMTGWAASRAPFRPLAASVAASPLGWMPSTASARFPSAPRMFPAAPPSAPTVSVSCWTAPFDCATSKNLTTPSVTWPMVSETPLMPPVTSGLKASSRTMPALTPAASRLPIEPSMVAVEVAACLAASVMPRSITALLNSSAEIWPFSKASRKFPV